MTSSDDPRNAQAGHQRPRHILVAEDDEILSDLLQILLANEGFTVTVTKDSDATLASLDQAPVDLILMDIMIPGLSGFDLLRTVKANPLYSAIPVVMLSSRKGERDQVQAFDFGATDFIAKPFRVEDLIVRVKRVLARQSHVEK